MMSHLRSGSRVGAVVLAALALAGCNDPQSLDVTLTAEGRVGQELSESLSCAACHSANGDDSAGPTWKGLFGETVTLSGTTVILRLADGRRVDFKQNADGDWVTPKAGEAVQVVKRRQPESPIAVVIRMRLAAGARPEAAREVKMVVVAAEGSRER